VWLDTLFYSLGLPLRKPAVDTVHELVGRFDRLTFVLLHAGGSQALQVAEAVRDSPNAYLDLSFTLCRYPATSLRLDLLHLVNTFDRRLVFGSDFPEFGIREAYAEFTRFAAGTLPVKRSNVLGRNLQNILVRRAAADRRPHAPREEASSRGA